MHVLDEASLRKLAEDYPSVLESWLEPLRADPDLTARLVGDLLRNEAGQARSGCRPPLEFDEGLARFRELFGD